MIPKFNAARWSYIFIRYVDLTLSTLSFLSQSCWLITVQRVLASHLHSNILLEGSKGLIGIPDTL